MNLTSLEFSALLAVMALLTGIIGWVIKWGVETLVIELRDLSKSVGSLREELHKLAMRVLSLEEWRKNGGGRRHDDPPDDPAPVRWHSAD